MMKSSPRYLSHDVIWRLIQEVDAVSFDFFDTLFIRPLCDPEDIFDIVGDHFGLLNFRDIRKSAQAEAFRRMKKRGRLEITLEDIYDCLDMDIPRSEVMRTEYETELTFLKPNDELIPIYVKSIEAKKLVSIISDMYLPKDFFTECLKRHSLPEVPLFISSECNATKRDSGELFDLVIKTIDKYPDRILHIGDNPFSDIQRAREKGMQTHLYRESYKPASADRIPPLTSVAKALIRVHSSIVTPDSYKEIGFKFGGPAAVGFLDWIIEQSRVDKIDHILFLSRDGYILNRLTMLQKSDQLPRYHYFWGSRVAFSMAAMDETSFAAYIPFLLSGSDGLAPRELLERIGVPPPSAEVMAELGVGDDIKVLCETRNTVIRFLYAFRWEILKICQRNRRALFKYLINLGITDGCRVALVDVGWNGTTQEAFERSIKKLVNLDVFGYYFSLSNLPECLERQQKYKMISMTSSQQLTPDFNPLIYQNRTLVELLFSAPHCSIIGWNDIGNGIIPIEDRGRGNAPDLTSSINEIAKGAELFAKSFWQLREDTDLKGMPIQIASPLLDLIKEGNWRSMPLFSQIHNFDTWGSSRNHDIKLIHY